MRSQPSVSHCVITGGLMLSAIDFCDEAAFNTREIRDIGAYGMLSPKTVPGKLPPAQRLPKVMLGVGHAAAELSRKIFFCPIAH